MEMPLLELAFLLKEERFAAQPSSGIDLRLGSGLPTTTGGK